MHKNLSLCIYLKKIWEITPSDKKKMAVPLFFLGATPMGVIRNLLFQLGFNYLWYEQDNLNINFDVLNTRLLYQFYQSWHNTIENCEKLSIYKLIKTEYVMEEYLSKNINVKLLSYLRYGVLKLNVETGTSGHIML